MSVLENTLLLFYNGSDKREIIWLIIEKSIPVNICPIKHERYSSVKSLQMKVVSIDYNPAGIKFMGSNTMKYEHTNKWTDRDIHGGWNSYLDRVKAILWNNTELYTCVGIIRKPLICIKSCLKYFWDTHKRLFEVHLVIDIALTELINTSPSLGILGRFTFKYSKLWLWDQA